MKKILTAFVLFLISLSGCAFKENINFSSEVNTQIGEALLPSDILFLLKIDTNNENEYNNLQLLKNIFFEEDRDPEAELKIVLEQSLEKFDLSYENDIKPLFGERTETLFGLGGDLINQNPNFYIIQSLTSSEKYTEIINKLLQKKLIENIPNGYKTVQTSEEKIFFGQRDDYLVLANDQDEFNRMITLPATESLVYNENYINLRKNLPDSFFALTYFNIKALINDVQDVITQNEAQIEKDVLSVLDTSVLNVVKNVGASLNLEKEGIKFWGHIQGDENVMQELNFYFDEVANQNTYLTDFLPGRGLYLYIEAFNLKNKFKQFEKGLKKADTETYHKYKKQKEIFKTTIGLDLDEDVLSWLDRSIAFVIQHTETFIPGITLAVNVKSNPEGAAKLIETLDSFLSIAMLSLQGYTEAIQKKEIKLDEVTFEQISFLPENLPLDIQEKGNLIVSILSDLKISYGITDENILIFTTYPDITNDFKNNVVANNINYKQTVQKVNKKGQGIFFFSPENFIEHLNTILKINQKYISMSNEDRENIKILKDFLQLFKAFVFTSIGHSESLEAQGYLKIKQ